MIPYHVRNRLRRQTEETTAVSSQPSKALEVGSRCPKTGFPVNMMREAERRYKEKQVKEEENNTYWWCIEKGCTRTRKNDDEWVQSDDQFKLVERLTEIGHLKIHISPLCDIHTAKMLQGKSS